MICVFKKQPNKKQYPPCRMNLYTYLLNNTLKGTYVNFTAHNSMVYICTFCNDQFQNQQTKTRANNKVCLKHIQNHYQTTLCNLALCIIICRYSSSGVVINFDGIHDKWFFIKWRFVIPWCSISLYQYFSFILSALGYIQSIFDWRVCYKINVPDIYQCRVECHPITFCTFHVQSFENQSYSSYEHKTDQLMKERNLWL